MRLSSTSIAHRRTSPSGRRSDAAGRPTRRHSAKLPVNIFLTTLLASLVSLRWRPVDGRKLDDIFWNSSNTMFDISNTEHVKQVELLDRVTILCPQPMSGRRYEFSKLYMVSREGYDNCVLSDERQLGVCSTPERQSSINIVFRDFSPLPSALKFQAGQSYYVITTSDGTEQGLNGTAGGLCLTRNMKMKFDVMRESSATRSRTTQNPYLPPDFSVLPASGVDSKPSPILYIIHTSEPESPLVPSASSSSTNSHSSGAFRSWENVDGNTTPQGMARLDDRNSASTQLLRISIKLGCIVGFTIINTMVQRLSSL